LWGFTVACSTDARDAYPRRGRRLINVPERRRERSLDGDDEDTG
jgi:hypothetical protein